MILMAIIAREYRENRLLPPLGLAIGFGMFLLPRMAPADALTQADIYHTAWIFVGVILALVLGILLGAGLQGPDLQEGRAGFFLSRPLAPSTLMAGKLLGAFVLASASGFLVWLPSLLHQWVPIDGHVPLWLAALILGAILLGHAVAIAFRDLSIWLLLDCAMLLSLASGSRWMIGRLAVLDPPRIGIFLQMLAGGLLAALLAGAFAQAHWGRTDLRRGHRALSLAVGLVLLLGGASAWAWLERIGHPALASIPGGQVQQAGRTAPWVFLQETAANARSLPSQVLVNTETGHTLRVGATAILAPSGLRAAGLEYTLWPEAGPPRLWVADLGYRAKLRPTSIRLGQGTHAQGRLLLALDEAGQRLACFSSEGLEVYDLGRESLLFRHRAPRAGLHWSDSAAFLDRDHLRAYLRPPNGGNDAQEIFELDLTRGRWTRTGTVELAEGRVVERNAQGSLLLGTAQIGKESVWALLDGRTGQIRKVLSRLGHPASARWVFLADGSLLGVACDDQGAHLHHLDSAGLDLWTTKLDGATPPTSGVQAFPRIFLEDALGSLMIGIGYGGSGHRQRQEYRVDLGARRVTMQDSGAAQAELRRFRGRDLAGPWPAGSWAGTLRMGPGGSLGRLQADGTLQWLIPGAKP